MLARSMSRTISIVGAGRVGKTLAKRLRQLGWRIGAVVTRSKATARAAVLAVGAGDAHATLTSDVFDAGIILICTPDDALSSVAKSLAQIGGATCRGKIMLHTSGTLDRRILAPLARLGASTGSLHPMQTFSGRGIPNLKNVTFAVEGDRRALMVARQITKALDGVPISINGKDKPAYHATAVLVCGSEFALMEAAIRILTRIGFTRRRALQTLLPLTRQMLDNIQRLGPRAAWTGPMSRGDYAIIAKHAKALRKYPREYLNAYAALAQLAGRVLSKNSPAAIKQLKRALSNG